MNKMFRLSKLCLTLISIPVFIFSTNAFAQPSHHTYNKGYDHGYDDGYEDGYDDAMDDCPCPPSLGLTGGFYAGVGVGYEGFQIKRNPWVFDDPIGSLNTHANGWNGRLFGGYGRYFMSHYYLAAELFAGTSGASGKDSLNTSGFQYDGKFSAGTSLGVSVLPGYRFTETGPLVYGRLGYIDTEFKVQDWSGMSGSNYTHWTGGFNAGLGVEIPLYKKLTGRLEYDYMNYNSFNNNGMTGSKNSPTDNRGSLDFVFHF
ncbi:MAG TPA: outer membrane beta-barrel protein [Gammaproteobacteria bacterium]|nr:outer membrane beta-barrel protein [Gammaproteobacteria bacterium]